MYKTQYTDVNKILEELFKQIQAVLGKKLVGLYLNGSLVIGDFEPEISDIDFVAALTSEITDEEFEALKNMHDQFVKEHTEWNDRIEVCYITISALQSVKTETNMLVNISPGEPINRKEAKKEWLMNWYLTRESGKILFGPSPKEIIEPIAKEEFIQCVKDHAKAWDIWVINMRNPYAQSYAIFSICRALYAVKKGEQVSKKKAAQWALKEYPEWAEIINNAMKWRHGGKYNPADDISHPKTVQFINTVRKIILED